METFKNTIQPIKGTGFGQSDKRITRVGLGGEGILRSIGKAKEAEAVIKAAVDQGISYFDSARVYLDSEIYLGRHWKDHPDQRKSIFQTSKSAQRTREGALAELTQTLKRLNTEQLDLWQIHDIRDERDLAMISGKGGALEAFVEAREMGLARFIGVTGHHDPAILTKAVTMWPVDAVLLPVNPVEEILGGFLTQTLDAAHQKGIAVIGMKVLGQKHYISKELGITPELLISFALSYDISLAIVGCKTPDEVKALADTGAATTALTPAERKEITRPFARMAKRLAFYRGSIFDMSSLP